MPIVHPAFGMDEVRAVFVPANLSFKPSCRRHFPDGFNAVEEILNHCLRSIASDMIPFPCQRFHVDAVGFSCPDSFHFAIEKSF